MNKWANLKNINRASAFALHERWPENIISQLLNNKISNNMFTKEEIHYEEMAHIFKLTKKIHSLPSVIWRHRRASDTKVQMENSVLPSPQPFSPK